jgi:hypothetical protein
VRVGTAIANVCYSAESAVLYTRGPKLVRPKRVLLFTCRTEIAASLIVGGYERFYNRDSGAGEQFC